jgi:glycosyltransferase involved in cell wall biosynthesis
LLPLRVRRLARAHRPAAIVTQSPYEAACVWLARTRAKVIVELHGDWRTATRLYGSRLRRALSPLADAVGAFGLRRADAVRTVSTYTSDLVRELGVEPAREFAAFMDLELFLERPPEPLPEQPAALFVGVLELYKNVDGLARSWRLAAPRVPGASLRLVGRGTQREVVEQLVRDLPGQTSWTERLTQAEVAEALDEATCLVLPSRSEGLGRVLVEAFLRGRPAVAMGVGGITDVVTDGVDGLLVDSDEELADALVRVLQDRALAERLASSARPSGERWLTTPEEFAARLAELVEATA